MSNTKHTNPGHSDKIHAEFLAIKHVSNWDSLLKEKGQKLNRICTSAVGKQVKAEPMSDL